MALICLVFLGVLSQDQRKAKASLVFAWLTQRDQDFFPSYGLTFNKI